MTKKDNSDIEEVFKPSDAYKIVTPMLEDMIELTLMLVDDEPISPIKMQ